MTTLIKQFKCHSGAEFPFISGYKTLRDIQCIRIMCCKINVYVGVQYSDIADVIIGHVIFLQSLLVVIVLIIILEEGHLWQVFCDFIRLFFCFSSSIIVNNCNEAMCSWNHLFFSLHVLFVNEHFRPTDVIYCNIYIYTCVWINYFIMPLRF